jgi:hypothetical protein
MFGALVHLTVLMGMVPALWWMSFVPLGCAVLLPPGRGRQYSRACCWFNLDMLIVASIGLVVVVLAALAFIGGALLTMPSVPESEAGQSIGVFRLGSLVGPLALWMGIIAFSIMYLWIFVRTVRHTIAAAAAARDGGWHVYPLLFISQTKTEERD